LRIRAAWDRADNEVFFTAMTAGASPPEASN